MQPRKEVIAVPCRSDWELYILFTELDILPRKQTCLNLLWFEKGHELAAYTVHCSFWDQRVAEFGVVARATSLALATNCLVGCNFLITHKYFLAQLPMAQQQEAK